MEPTSCSYVCSATECVATWVESTNEKAVYLSRPKLNWNCTTPPTSPHNATKKIGSQKTKARNQEGGILQNLHIQAFKACAAKQHHLFKSDEHNELAGQRSLPPGCEGGQPGCPEEREGNIELERDPDGSEASLSGGARHPRLRRGRQGQRQV